MTVVAVGSVKASPGATTLVLSLGAVWPAGRKLLVVEADPDGGALAARCRLRFEPGLSTLAAAWRHSNDPATLEKHAQALPGGTPAVVAPADPDQTARALAVVAPRLAETVAQIDSDVLVDIGRLRASSPALPLVDAADTVLVVARPRLDELQAVAPRVRALRQSGVNVSLLLAGDRPYSPEEVAAALGVPVLGVVAEDPSAARMLAGHGGSEPRLRRSHLLRSVRELVGPLLAEHDRAIEPPDTAADERVRHPQPGGFTARAPIDVRSPS